MTVEQAQTLFEEEAYTPGPVALSEAKRGTSDATYGYYTLGKLMILKLRDDYSAKKGARPIEGLPRFLPEAGTDSAASRPESSPWG